MVDLFDDVYLGTFQKHQILFFVFFAVFLECLLEFLIARALSEAVPVGEPKPIVLAISQLLGHLEYVFEQQQANSALVERRERQVAAVLDYVVHEPAEVQLGGQHFAVL